MFPALYGRRPSAANKTTALLLFVAAVVFSARIVFAVTAADHGPSLSDEREIPGDHRWRESRLKSQVMAYNIVGLLYPFAIYDTIIALAVGVFVIVAVLLILYICCFSGLHFDTKNKCKRCKCHKYSDICGSNKTAANKFGPLRP